jgi:hypothetical protein
MSYEIIYDLGNNSSNINSTGMSLECVHFSEILDQAPSDRHAYKMKCFTHPISIGRLPLMAKNFLKFARLALT